jgi:single-strand DNA-binding protein
MKGINKFIAIGNLAHPALRESKKPDGTPANYFTASLAINSEKVDKVSGNKSVETLWIDIVIFDKLADLAAQYLTKGDLVYIEGKLNIGEYTDKNNIKRQKTSVVIAKFEKLNKSGKNGEQTHDE